MNTHTHTHNNNNNIFLPSKHTHARAHTHTHTHTQIGDVIAVDSASSLQATTGDVLMMKGGLWKGYRGRGTAHRAPAIGAVPVCTKYRLVLKVDIWGED